MWNNKECPACGALAVFNETHELKERIEHMMYGGENI